MADVALNAVKNALKAHPDDPDAAVAQLTDIYGASSLEVRLATAYRDYTPMAVSSSEMVRLKRSASGAAPTQKRLQAGSGFLRGTVETGRSTSDLPHGYGRNKPTFDRPLPMFGVDPVVAYEQGASPFLGVRIYITDTRSAFDPA